MSSTVNNIVFSDAVATDVIQSVSVNVYIITAIPCPVHSPTAAPWTPASGGFVCPTGGEIIRIQEA